MPVHLPLQFQPALLRLTHLAVQFRQPRAHRLERLLLLEDAARVPRDLLAQLLQPPAQTPQLRLRQVKLIPRQLRVQVLQLVHQLLVTPRLARLPLQRAYLTLHLADQVLKPRQVLLRVIQLAQCLLLLLFKLGDARRLLEDHPPLLRRAVDDARDLPLRHDRVARLPHARAQEKLPHITQSARRVV